MEFDMETIMTFVGKGFVMGIIFSNVAILSGWGVRQLMIFFKNIIN